MAEELMPNVADNDDVESTENSTESAGISGSAGENTAVNDDKDVEDE